MRVTLRRPHLRHGNSELAMVSTALTVSVFSPGSPSSGGFALGVFGMVVWKQEGRGIALSASGGLEECSKGRKAAMIFDSLFGVIIVLPQFSWFGDYLGGN